MFLKREKCSLFSVPLQIITLIFKYETFKCIKMDAVSTFKQRSYTLQEVHHPFTLQHGLTQ